MTLHVSDQRVTGICPGERSKARSMVRRQRSAEGWGDVVWRKGSQVVVALLAPWELATTTTGEGGDKRRPYQQPIGAYKTHRCPLNCIAIVPAR